MSQQRDQTPDVEFKKRQDAAKEKISQSDRDQHYINPRRDQFFETVYENAGRDAAMVPWADLEAKKELSDYLKANRGSGKRAVDIGCGLGDNAEAIAKAGYQTLGFDFSPKAINWAKERFGSGSVDYQVGDLFDLPKDWVGQFDLVHECYTLQSIPPMTLAETIPAICSLVAYGGTLLVYSRLRDDGSVVDGPPWPLERSVAQSFGKFGLTLKSETPFFIERWERSIEHTFTIWEKH